ncbi:MAG: hypothetical protein ACI9HK_003907, partial [Pirellulaceae bacterium]
KLEEILMEGAKKARYQCSKIMKRARRAVGVRHQRQLLIETT